jgi:hypothetical protein
MHDIPEPEFLNGSPEIDSKESIPPDWKIPALETDVCVADHLYVQFFCAVVYIYFH